VVLDVAHPPSGDQGLFVESIGARSDVAMDACHNL